MMWAWEQRAKITSSPHFYIGTFLTVTVLLSFFVFNSWQVDDSVNLGPSVNIISSSAQTLRQLIHDATARGKAAQALATRSVSAPVFVREGGIDYSLSSADFTQKEAVRTVDAPKDKTDPFDKDHRETSLYVASLTVKVATKTQDVRGISVSTDPTVSLATAASPYVTTKSYFVQLNKFNTIKDHALLVTDVYEEQSTPLDVADLAAWYYAVMQTNSVGFYNSDFAAGASQRHKHMQVIPRDEFWSTRPADAETALPVDKVILPLILSKAWQPAHCASLRVTNYPTQRMPGHVGWDFEHSIAVLQGVEDDAESERREDHMCQYSRVLHAYCAVLRDIGASAPACAHSSSVPVSAIPTVSYNVLLTRQWIMVVARTKRSAMQGAVGVNCFGFVGLFLARDKAAVGAAAEAGPLSLLRNVTRLG